RAVRLARAEVGPDHGHEWSTQPEHQRNQEVLEPRTGAVTRDRGGAKPSDEARRHRDRQIGLDGDQCGDGADAQNFAEEGPAETGVMEREADDAPPSPEVYNKDGRSDSVVRNDRHCATSDSEFRERAPAKNET